MHLSFTFGSSFRNFWGRPLRSWLRSWRLRSAESFAKEWLARTRHLRSVWSHIDQNPGPYTTAATHAHLLRLIEDCNVLESRLLRQLQIVDALRAGDPALSFDDLAKAGAFVGMRIDNMTQRRQKLEDAIEAAHMWRDPR